MGDGEPQPGNGVMVAHDWAAPACNRGRRLRQRRERTDGERPPLDGERSNAGPQIIGLHRRRIVDEDVEDGVVAASW